MSILFSFSPFFAFPFFLLPPHPSRMPILASKCPRSPRSTVSFSPDLFLSHASLGRSSRFRRRTFDRRSGDVRACFRVLFSSAWFLKLPKNRTHRLAAYVLTPTAHLPFVPFASSSAPLVSTSVFFSRVLSPLFSLLLPSFLGRFRSSLCHKAPRVVRQTKPPRPLSGEGIVSRIVEPPTPLADAPFDCAGDLSVAVPGRPARQR